MELSCLSTLGPNGIPVWTGGPAGGGALSGGSGGGGVLLSGGGGGGAVSVGAARESTGWASDGSTVDPPSHAPTASANATENVRPSPFMLSTASEPTGFDAVSCTDFGLSVAQRTKKPDVAAVFAGSR
jgi:hypothetical protein